MNREEQEEAGLEHAPAERSEGRRVLETAGRSHFGLGKSWPLQGLEPASDAPARPEGAKDGGIANASLIGSLASPLPAAVYLSNTKEERIALMGSMLRISVMPLAHSSRPRERPLISYPAAGAWIRICRPL